MAWTIHYPDEVNPEISFTPNIAPVLAETRRQSNRNVIEDEMFDGRTLITTRHGPRIIGYSFGFIALTNAKLEDLEAFIDAADGHVFRMIDFVTGDWGSFKQIGSLTEAIFKRTSEGDGWNLGMRVRKVN